MSELQIISRKDALAAGSKRYFLGPDKPCPKGHVAERLTSGSQCVVCTNQRAKKWRGENIDHVNECRRAIHAENNDHINDLKRRWREENPDRDIAYSAKYREENRDKLNAKAAERRALYPEKIAASQRGFYVRNIEYMRDRAKIWRSNNREQHNALVLNRHARIRRAEGFHTHDEIIAMREKQKCKCANCLTSIKKKHHVDHIIPLSKGGSNWITNLQLLCPTCNLRKSAKDPIKFARENGRLL